MAQPKHALWERRSVWVRPQARLGRPPCVVCTGCPRDAHNARDPTTIPDTMLFHMGTDDTSAAPIKNGAATSHTPKTTLSQSSPFSPSRYIMWNNATATTSTPSMSALVPIVIPEKPSTYGDAASHKPAAILHPSAVFVRFLCSIVLTPPFPSDLKWHIERKQEPPFRKTKESGHDLVQPLRTFLSRACASSVRLSDTCTRCSARCILQNARSKGFRGDRIPNGSTYTFHHPQPLLAPPDSMRPSHAAATSRQS